jgi:hypothetical protein
MRIPVNFSYLTAKVCAQSSPRVFLGHVENDSKHFVLPLAVFPFPLLSEAVSTYLSLGAF